MPGILVGYARVSTCDQQAGLLSMGGQTIDTRGPTSKLIITMLAGDCRVRRGLCWNVSGRVSPRRGLMGNTRAGSRRHAPGPPR